MASPAQIESNRGNSLKSTGPTSAAGKAASRLNAVKSGIYAKELILPGEDLAEFESLTANYQQQLRPVTPVEQFLVDSLIENDWRLRRLRKAETRLWANYSDPSLALEDPALIRLYRLIAATRRAYSQSLKELKHELAVTEPVCSEQMPAEPEPAATQLPATASDPDPAPELASFRHEPDPAPPFAASTAPVPQSTLQTAPATRFERAAEPKALPKINLALRL
jgi:hypothetical protein